VNARLAVLAAAVLFSTGGAAIKATDLDAWQVASFRCAVALVVALAFLPGVRARPTRRSILASLAYAATLVLFVRSNKMTTAANAIFLQSTAPIWLVVLAPRLLGESVRRRDLVLLAVFFGGLLLFFTDPPTAQATAPDPFRGDLVATIAGLTWALLVLALRGLERREPGSGAPVLLYGNLIGFLGCLPFALPVVGAGAADVGIVLYLGTFQVGLAYVALTYGMRGVPALEASLLLFVEPVLSPVWAYAVHGEVPGRFALIGGAVILGATATQTILESRRRPILEIVDDEPRRNGA
jgi:drug/metabolite transporter, DME family